MIDGERQARRSRQDSKKTIMVARAIILRSGGRVHVNRRNFLKVAGTATTQTLLVGTMRAMTRDGEAVTVLQPAQDEPAKPAAANDHIQIALIGAGGQGMYDTGVAVRVPVRSAS